MANDNIRAIGFLFLTNDQLAFADAEDYFDFTRKIWTRPEIISDLRTGTLPQGLILADVYGKIGTVIGRCGKTQTLASIHHAIALNGLNFEPNRILDAKSHMKNGEIE